MKVLKDNLSIIFKNEIAKQFSLGCYQDHKWHLFFKEIREKHHCWMNTCPAKYHVALTMTLLFWIVCLLDREFKALFHG